MTIQLDDGKYVVTVQALKKNEDEKSAMAPYLSETAIVTVLEGKTYVTLMLKEQQVVTDFQIALDEEAFISNIDYQINEELNSRYEMFELEELKGTLLARVQYELTYEGQRISGDEQLRIVLDEDSIENVENIQLED